MNPEQDKDGIWFIMLPDGQENARNQIDEDEKPNQWVRKKRIIPMSLTEQHISAQVWVCNGCGGHDRKSCSCAGATAKSREVQAAKREATRQRVAKHREKKANENNGDVTRYAPVENVERSPEEENPTYCMSSEHFGQSAWQFKRMSGSSRLKVQAAIGC